MSLLRMFGDEQWWDMGGSISPVARNSRPPPFPETLRRCLLLSSMFERCCGRSLLSVTGGPLGGLGEEGCNAPPSSSLSSPYLFPRLLRRLCCDDILSSLGASHEYKYMGKGKSASAARVAFLLRRREMCRCDAIRRTEEVSGGRNSLVRGMSSGAGIMYTLYADLYVNSLRYCYIRVFLPQKNLSRMRLFCCLATSIYRYELLNVLIAVNQGRSNACETLRVSTQVHCQLHLYSNSLCEVHPISCFSFLARASPMHSHVTC